MTGIRVYMGFFLVSLFFGALCLNYATSVNVSSHLRKRSLTPICGRAGCRCRDSPFQKPGAVCHREFVSYSSSTFEDRWVKKIKRIESSTEPAICREIAKEKEVFLRMYDFTTKVEEDYQQEVLASVNASFDEEIFSFFTYKVVCEDESNPLHNRRVRVAIEPLVGMLRDARGVCDSLPDRRIGSESMIVLSKAIEGAGASINILDLGASGWSKGLGSSSQNWLIKQYTGVNAAGFCLLSYRGFEPNEKEFPLSSFINDIPDEIFPAYSIFNIPVSAEEDDKLNPLNYVKNLVPSSDFLALKLDIDTPKVEQAIIEQFLKDKAAQEKVDEFFFEHHTTFFEMREKGWGWWKVEGLVSDTYKIMLKLRKSGVRAHAWP